MATFDEIISLRGTVDYDTLKNRIAVALIVKAKAISDLASPTNAQMALANKAFSEPVHVADSVINYVLAANIGLTLAQIKNASDANIQSAVNTAVDKLLAL